MSHTENHYTIVKAVSSPYEEALEKTKKALADQGFGILTEIDVSATLKKKINVDYPKTIILGACNPSLAHQTLMGEPDIGVFLPCNVIVRENTQGQVEIAAMNPLVLKQYSEHPAVASVAEDANQRIRTALQTMA